MTIRDMKLRMMPLLLQKMLTPDIIHSSFWGNHALSFDGMADRKMCEMAQKDCITSTNAKSWDATAKYFSHDVEARPKDPNIATEYSDCREKSFRAC